MSGQPWFSIITPTLDRAAGLRRAVISVLEQEFESFEHVVVDGGSVDETPEVLRAHRHLHAIVGRDGGIYDALNKGVAAARGQWLVFLNSDDRLAGGALQALALAGDRAGAVAQIGGRARFTAEDGSRLGRYRSTLDLADLAFGAPVFNARAYAAAALRAAGPFDASLTLAGDRDYLIRVRLAGTAFAPIDAETYVYTVHPGSLTLSAPDRERAGLIAREHAAIATRALAGATSRGDRAILRAWLAHESARARPGDGTTPRGAAGAWRALAAALKTRTALRRVFANRA